MDGSAGVVSMGPQAVNDKIRVSHKEICNLGFISYCVFLSEINEVRVRILVKGTEGFIFE